MFYSCCQACLLLPALIPPPLHLTLPPRRALPSTPPPTPADSASVLEILLAESQHQGLNFLRLENGRTDPIGSDPLWVARKSGQDWIGCRLKMERLAAGGARHPEGGLSCPPLALIQEVGRMSAIPPHSSACYSDLALPIQTASEYCSSVLVLHPNFSGLNPTS